MTVSFPITQIGFFGFDVRISDHSFVHSFIQVMCKSVLVPASIEVYGSWNALDNNDRFHPMGHHFAAGSKGFELWQSQKRTSEA